MSDPASIANSFNDFFTNIKGDSKYFINEKFRQYKQNSILKTTTFSFKTITEANVLEAIKTLDNSSSCGITEIPVSVIKNSGEAIVPFLTQFLNSCITSGKIPNDLKCAIAFPLFKKGDSSSCDN